MLPLVRLTSSLLIYFNLLSTCVEATSSFPHMIFFLVHIYKFVTINILFVMIFGQRNSHNVINRIKLKF